MKRTLMVLVGVVVIVAGLGAIAGAVGRDPGLENSLLTPGATNPRVTQMTIHSTICVAGYTATIRPPETYTEHLKYRQLDSGYNVAGDTAASHYEEDHLIPLEVGGSPRSVKNLWPEPWMTKWNAGKKDVLENVMHRLVCTGAVSLAAAQRVFVTDWIAGYQRYVVG